MLSPARSTLNREALHRLLGCRVRPNPYIPYMLALLSGFWRHIRPRLRYAVAHLLNGNQERCWRAGGSFTGAFCAETAPPFPSTLRATSPPKKRLLSSPHQLRGSRLPGLLLAFAGPSSFRGTFDCALWAGCIAPMAVIKQAKGYDPALAQRTLGAATGAAAAAAATETAASNERGAHSAAASSASRLLLLELVGFGLLRPARWCFIRTIPQLYVLPTPPS